MTCQFYCCSDGPVCQKGSIKEANISYKIDMKDPTYGNFLPSIIWKRIVLKESIIILLVEINRR